MASSSNPPQDATNHMATRTLKHWMRALTLPSLVMALGLVAASVNYVVIRREASLSLERDAEEHFRVFTNKLKMELDEWLNNIELVAQEQELAVHIAQSLNTTDSDASRRALLVAEQASFLRKAASVRDKRLGYVGVSWSPVVLHPARARLEADRAVVVASSSPLVIRDFGTSSTPAAARELYVPVLYHHLLSHPILMRDRLTHPPSNATLFQALETGQPSVGGPLPLYEATASTGLLAVRPIWPCPALSASATISQPKVGMACAAPQGTVHERLRAMHGAVFASVNVAAVADGVQTELKHLGKMYYWLELKGSVIWRSPEKPATSDLTSSYSALDNRAPDPGPEAFTISIGMDHAVGTFIVYGRATALLEGQSGVLSSTATTVLVVLVAGTLLMSAVSIVVSLYTTRAIVAETQARNREERSKIMAILQRTSHDLRSPLQTITMASELLMTQLQRVLEQAQVKIAPRLHRSKRKTPIEAFNGTLSTVVGASSVLRLIADNVLDANRIDRGEEVELLEHHVELAVELKNLARVMSHSTYASTKVKLSSICSKHVPEVIVIDREKLIRVVLNLVNNSLKFTRQGGVDVIARLATSDELRGRVRRLHACAEFKTGAARILVGEAAKPAVVVDREFSAVEDAGGRSQSFCDGLILSLIKFFTPGESGSARVPSAAPAVVQSSATVTPMWAVTADPDIATHAAILFAVRDSGLGMTAEELERSASSWYRSSLKHGGGYGLGLRVVSEFVEALGGRLGGASEKGTGTIFSFVTAVRIVRSSKQKQQDVTAKSSMFNAATRTLLHDASSGTSHSDSETGSETVDSSDEGKDLALIVDDNESSSSIASSILQAANYKVQRVTTIERLSRTLIKGNNQLAFILVSLSTIGQGERGARDGADRIIASIRAVRSAVRHTAVQCPVIGMVDDEMVARHDFMARFSAEGVDGIVRMPFDMTALHSTLKSVRRKQRIRSGLASSTGTSSATSDDDKRPARRDEYTRSGLRTVEEEEGEPSPEDLSVSASAATHTPVVVDAMSQPASGALRKKHAAHAQSKDFAAPAEQRRSHPRDSNKGEIVGARAPRNVGDPSAAPGAAFEAPQHERTEPHQLISRKPRRPDRRVDTRSTERPRLAAVQPMPDEEAEQLRQPTPSQQDRGRASALASNAPKNPRRSRSGVRSSSRARVPKSSTAAEVVTPDEEAEAASMASSRGRGHEPPPPHNAPDALRARV